MLVHEYKCLFLTFVFLQIERERESGIRSLGIKEKWPESYLSYFSTGFNWRIFLLSRANRLCSIFSTGLKNLGSFVSQVYFCLQPGILAMIRLPATNPAQKTTLSYYLLTLREGVPTSVLRSQPIIWLLSSPPWCPATWGY